MPTISYYRGHETWFEWIDEEALLGVWRYTDTGEPIPGWGGEERACPGCGLTADGPDDPDPCLGRLPGVRSACCGHGRTAAEVEGTGVLVALKRRMIGRAYVMYDDGTTVEGIPPELLDAAR